MTLHVVVGVLVGVDQQEPELVELDAGTDVEILRLVVLGHLNTVAFLVGLLDASALNELAANNTWGKVKTSVSKSFIALILVLYKVLSFWLSGSHTSNNRLNL